MSSERDSNPAPPPGKPWTPLLTALAIHGRLRSPPDQEIAEDVAALAPFAEGLVQALQAHEPVLLCGGVMCTLNGSAEFQVELGRALDDLALTRRWTVVHCLAHCDSGPNLAVRGMIYSVQSGKVVGDQLALRRRLAGGAKRLGGEELACSSEG